MTLLPVASPEDLLTLGDEAQQKLVEELLKGAREVSWSLVLDNHGRLCAISFGFVPLKLDKQDA